MKLSCLPQLKSSMFPLRSLPMLLSSETTTTTIRTAIRPTKTLCATKTISVTTITISQDQRTDLHNHTLEGAKYVVFKAIQPSDAPSFSHTSPPIRFKLLHSGHISHALTFLQDHPTLRRLGCLTVVPHTIFTSDL